MTAHASGSSQATSAAHLARLLSKVAKTQCRVAFAELFHYFAPRLQAYASSKFGNEQLAADLVQEAMTNVWQKAHLFNAERGSAVTWVFTIARNTGFDYLRKNKHRLTDLSADDLWPILASSEASLESDIDLDTHRLQQELAHYQRQLPESQQVILHMIYQEGKSQQEVAKELGIPLGTVKSRVRLALEKIREMIHEN
ncbi:RNA polymerase subunit sigma [Aliidiomarina taiwanensis]|uniref:RNA polymerase subunit sigma n=1 Tax=Aliidiomarina taiwanensis TaxID=946228 RepID=A0A432XAL2_9GAMM|nr:RNA polymerase subunit sigma [Aliidiomarina taiwanensis]